MELEGAGGVVICNATSGPWMIKAIRVESFLLYVISKYCVHLMLPFWHVLNTLTIEQIKILRKCGNLVSSVKTIFNFTKPSKITPFIVCLSFES